MTKVVSLTIRNRALAALFILALLGLGVVVFTVGFALLLGLALGGAVLGASVAVHRAIRGTRAPVGNAAHTTFAAPANGRPTGLDPSLEITAPRGAIVAPAPKLGDPSRDVKDS